MPIYFFKKACYNKFEKEKNMEKDNLSVSLNMNEYKQKVEAMSVKQLLKEKEKIERHLTVNYIFMGPNFYSVNQVNIKDDPEEKNRIYVRKKVSILTKMISGQLNQYTTDFASCWQFINKKFLETTSYGNHVTAILKGKTVPFADKLTVKGLTAYKKYLLVLSDNLSKGINLVPAAQDAIDTEYYADANLDRNKFYSRKYLPASIDAIFKNLIKSKIVDEQLAKVGTVENKDEMAK